VVGAPWTGSPTTGSVYVFERTGSAWTETAYLQPPDIDAVREFGSSVDIDGDRIVVIAPGANEKVGVAFVYELSDKGSWELLGNMTLTDTLGAYLYPTAISGDWVAIGASHELDMKGQVHLYSLPDLEETILQYNGQDTDVYGFGTELDLIGNVLVVGGFLVYEFNEGAWDPVFELPSYDPGRRVATDGSTIVVETWSINYELVQVSGVSVYGKGVGATDGSPTNDISATQPEAGTGDGKNETAKEETGDETGTQPEADAGDGKNETAKDETETDGENGTQPEADSGDGKNKTGTGSKTTPSSASAPFRNLLNFIFLVMTIAHVAIDF